MLYANKGADLSKNARVEREASVSGWKGSYNKSSSPIYTYLFDKCVQNTCWST